mmetsp:Transcript_56152/g.102975  ORF Transcript_56152/g.102975 Transcript_56152/m.102975 type:complete len:248 (+) Transcript_56152:90-833(+)
MADTLIYLPTNNCARVMIFLKLNGLEDKVQTKSPGDFGGLSSEEYLKFNPQGKMPALIKADGSCIYESQVILEYLADKYAEEVKQSCTASTPELRAQAALLLRVHDLYIASASCNAPGHYANQGMMYKTDVPMPQRSAQVQDLKKQLDEIERLMDASGPWAVGTELTYADVAMFPTYIFITELSPRSFGWGSIFSTRPKSGAWFAKCDEHEAFAAVAKDVRDFCQNVMKSPEKIKADIDENGKDLPW